MKNFWSTFKHGIIGIYQYASPQHLQRYAAKFEYRYNNRQDTSVEKFETAVKGADSKRITYDTLTGKQ